MDIISKDELHVQKDILYSRIRKGSLFIHPTDTIYGIGCDATNKESVFKVREAKNRYDSPFSIIAPSKQWIKKNCFVNDKAEKWLEKLPGPYTIVLKLKKKGSIAPNVNMDMDTIGVRIPDHWFSEFVKEINLPIITTSANVTNENFMTSEDNLDQKISSQMEFMIYEGEKHGKPSTVVDVAGDEPVVRER